jgi:quercetin dioxygenase-like cupin family protein
MTNKVQMDATVALLRNRSDLPIVPVAEGAKVQLLQVDFENNIRVERSIFSAGFTVPTHRHTGGVYALTLSGSWKYLEYPEVNIAGSYLYEPAGSTHTLVVPESNTEETEALFIVQGETLQMDTEGNVVGVADARSICDHYLARCTELGLPRPDVIGI